MEKLAIIDGNSLINRAFYALPILSNSSGEYCNALYGFCNILIKLITDEKPDYLAICFDAGKHTFRHDMFKDYKGTRKGMPEELAEQLPRLKEILKAMNIFCIEMQDIEADDLIGSISKKFDVKNIVLSGDKDLLQLINDNTEVYLTRKGFTEVDKMNESTLLEKMSVKPYQIIELKALMGDSSDNIPGVSGIGDKTGLKLINDYDNVENLYAHIDEIKGAVKDKLINGKDMCFLSKTLATIKTDVELDIKLEDLKYDFPFNQNVLKLFRHYEFNSLLKRENLFSEEIKKEETLVNVEIVENIETFGNLLKEIEKTNKFSIYIEDEKVYIAFSKFKEYEIKTENSLIGLSMNYVLDSLKKYLEDENYKKTCLDVKKLKRYLLKYNVMLNGAVFDVVLASYLLYGSDKYSQDTEFFIDRYGYASNAKASLVYGLSQELYEKLESENMLSLYFELEFPLIDVLFDMEKNGCKLNRELLFEVSERYQKEIGKVVDEIFALSGEKFNLNSPRQLGEILYDKLLIPKIDKKGSTAVEILEKLVGVHPIIEKILKYRKLFKLSSTYLEDFKKFIDSEDLIHTEFNQTLTSTGRLSSSEPNLQNIPVRDDEGRELRKLFVPRTKDGLIISADYSQIELRLLAHYSSDEKLCYAYNNNIDIHTQTASDIFSMPLNEVSDKERRKAKTVNFGIIYGISDYGLSQSLKISVKEAKEYITKYFETYSGVKKFMTDSVEKARETGYSTSILNRRRKIPELASPNKMVQSFGERAAMNMPLQGSSADIIKLAMIKVHRAMKEKNLKSKLILQIHDELIVDTVPGEEEIVKAILKENMENCVKLKIPLMVDINSGKDWYEAK